MATKWSFTEVTESGTDLDNYKEFGVYYFNSSYTPTNIPAGVNGWLIVLPGGSMVKQIWTRQGTSGSNDHQTWMRSYVSSAWCDWYRILTVKDGFSKTLLYTNGKPNNEFPVQSLSMNLSQYDAILVEARLKSDSYFDSFKKTSTICLIGHSAAMLPVYDNSDGSGWGYRVVTANTNSVAFRHGHDDQGNVSNAAAIPTSIYGIKFFGGVST